MDCTFSREKYLVAIGSTLLFLLLGLAPRLDASPASGQDDEQGEAWRHIDNDTFQMGEILVFRAMYNSFLTGNVTAGEATLQIRSRSATIDGEACYHIVGEANTRGVFNLFFKVENRYDSYIHKESIAPLRFSRDVREGRYRRQDNVVFDQRGGTATSERDTITTPPWVQDIISAFYFARTFDMSSVEPGDSFEVDFYLSDSVYVSRILYEGRERIRTRLGTFNTMKFKPQVLEGTVFSQPYPMTLWISDDKNKIPIRVESGLVVGTARLDLETFGGLRHDLTSFVPRP